MPHSRRRQNVSPARSGIWLGQSADNRIVHNLIHDFYYTGISRLDLGVTASPWPEIISSPSITFIISASSPMVTARS